jgi:PAS domain S-box-containing protein
VHFSVSILLLGIVLVQAVRLRRREAVRADDVFPLTKTKLDALLRDDPDSYFFSLRPDGMFSYSSPNAQRHFGVEPARLIGCPFAEWIHPDDRSCYARHLAEVANGENPAKKILRFCRPDGSFSWHSFNLRPLMDEKRVPLAFVGLLRNVQDLKQAEEELHRTNTKLHALAENHEAELKAATEEALTAAEGEARRIGQNLHDDLCHELIGLSRLAETIHLPAEACCRQCSRAFAEIHQQAVSLAGKARAYSHDLALNGLDVQSLPEAIESFAQLVERLYDVEIEVNIDGNALPPLGHAQINHIYRIVRECVANAQRHAKAGRICISAVREPEHLAISVENDGLPLPAKEKRVAGLGTHQIQMRTRLLGGAFTLSRDGQEQKTIAQLTLPHAQPEAM